MITLKQTELYNGSGSQALEGKLIAGSRKLTEGKGLIKPSNMELSLLDLKKYAKNKASSSILLNDAIALFDNENGGRIQLFNLQINSGTSDIPPYVPFYAGRYKTKVSPNVETGIFVNMYGIGNWSADEKDYLNLIVPSDLNACLESAYIAYKMTIENRAEDILSNAVVMENITKLYAKLFFDAICKIPGNMIVGDFEKQAAKFVIAKFFLVYILQKNINDELTDKYAQIATGTKISLRATDLSAYEANLGINYNSLTSFLSTFGVAFFSGRPTNTSDFVIQWQKLYGEGTILAIEYVPYLIHFLIATKYNANLGGFNKMQRKQSDLISDGLGKFYNALVVAVAKY